MPISHKIGGLPILSRIYDLNPMLVYLVVLLADFGAICLLMYLEGRPPWLRQQYKTFIYNDTIFLPVFAAVAAIVLKNAPALSGFYTKPAWHWFILISGFAISIGMEIAAVQSGQFTINQELSPSKIYHTFIFGIMLYWMISVLIPVLVVHRPAWMMIIVAGCFLGFYAMMYIDTTNPWPKDTHLEGSYVPWEWHVRK